MLFIQHHLQHRRPLFSRVQEFDFWQHLHQQMSVENQSHRGNCVLKGNTQKMICSQGDDKQLQGLETFVVFAWKMHFFGTGSNFTNNGAQFQKFQVQILQFSCISCNLISLPKGYKSALIENSFSLSF